MPKRPAPSSPSATAPKKAKAAPKAKTAAAEKSTLATVAETVKKGAKKAAAEIAAVVENAGALLTDDVAPEDSKATKTKKGKAPANAAPLPPRGTKRKTAEEFMDKAVASVADKVGGALSGVVREFGEASGLIEKATTVEKKAKSVTKKAEKPAVEKKAAAPKPKAASKGKKAAVPEPEAEAESEAEGSEASFIGAFESDDDEGANSSDDDSDDEDAAIKAAGQQIDMSKLPKAKDDKSVAARLKKAAKKKGVQRGTVFLGRIPHGFYEEQMKEYFNQFGDVTRLRLARNPKTGASRHYAYIEFSSAPVAEIVADTMNHYLLMGHLLRCNVIPADEVHPELWVGANKKWRQVPRARLEKVRQDKPRTQEQQERANANIIKRQEERRQKIKAAGIDYSFDGHQ